MTSEPGFAAFLGARLAALFSMQIQAVVGIWAWRFPALRKVDRFAQVMAGDRDSIG